MVYLARDQRLSSRPCAIKEMVDHFIDPQQRLEANEYFAREADTLAQLKHPAIPAITDRFDDQNRHYLVMEYVEGRNLEEEIAVNGGPLAEGLVIDIGASVVRGARLPARLHAAGGLPRHEALQRDADAQRARGADRFRYRAAVPRGAQGHR